LVENYGTKLGNLVVFLKKLFDKEPTTRVIIFSQFSDYLQTMEALLEEHDISCCTVEGYVKTNPSEYC
jgi:SNF2 family DNA or RNA helicase